MIIIPQFEFNKYNFGFGIVLRRENTSKKYNIKYKTISYVFGCIFLWFAFGFEIEMRFKYDGYIN